MATAGQVLTMLCPNVEWALIGEDFDDIDWFGQSPAISKKQFEAGFAQYDAWLAEQKAEAEAKKTVAEAKLATLGLTAEEIAALFK